MRAVKTFFWLCSIYTKACLTNGSEEVRMGVRKRQQKSQGYGIPNLVECHSSIAVTSPRTYERNKVGKKSLLTRQLNLPSKQTAYSLGAATSSWGSRILISLSSSHRGLMPFCRLSYLSCVVKEKRIAWRQGLHKHSSSFWHLRHTADTAASQKAPKSPRSNTEKTHNTKLKYRLSSSSIQQQQKSVLWSVRKMPVEEV